MTRKPFYKRVKFWKFVGIFILVSALFGAIYDATPAGKEAKRIIQAEEQAELDAKEERIAKREAEREVRRVEKEERKAREMASSNVDSEKVASSLTERPDKTAVKKDDKPATKSDPYEELPAKLAPLIASSEGVVLDIAPNPYSDDWKLVYVTVSDAWYASQEYEKERFAEVFGAAVKEIVGHDVMHVNYFDEYGKELATEKMLGGYKIKK